MKKLFLISLVLPTLLFASPVDLSTALQVAENFINAADASNTNAKKMPHTLKRMVSRSMSTECQQYYIFNSEDSCGFVIVSADNIAQPILAYSEKGYIDIENIPINMMDWLDMYDSEIKFAQDKGLSPDTATIDEWNKLLLDRKFPSAYAIIGPLLETEWSQGTYYNSQCPYDTNKKTYCVTGCVATAMAQVMKYWNFPQKGRESHSYNDDQYGVQYADFSNTTYQWSYMVNDLSILSSNANISSIAKLMYHCGVSVNMDYGTDESGASMNNVSDAVKNYFWYDDRTRLFYKEDYSEQEWIGLLIEQLELYGPIIYSGGSMITGGSHAFVCDGYNSDNKFHINWGWDVGMDGYYALSALKPSILGISSSNFTANQKAVFYMIPKSDTISRYKIEMDDVIRVYDDHNSYLEREFFYPTDSLYVDTYVSNVGFVNYTGRMICSLQDKNGNILTTSDTLDITIPHKFEYEKVSFCINDISMTKGGTYYISIKYLDSLGVYRNCGQSYYECQKAIMIKQKPNKHIILGKPNENSNWYYMTNVNCNTVYTPHLEGIDAGTKNALLVNKTGLADKYYWSIEEQQDGWYIKSGSQYLSWSSGNTAVVNDTPLLLSKNELNGDLCEFYFLDDIQNRYLSVNATEKYFSFYKGTQYQKLKIIVASDSTPTSANAIEYDISSSVRYNILGQIVGEDYLGVVITNGKKQLKIQ